MQLTQRQKEIVRIISQSQKNITSEQLLPELGCSLRTLRNEIHQINRMANAKLILSSNKGYSIDRELFNNMIFEVEGSPNHDIYLLLKALLFDQKEWNIFELGDTFYMSESTLYNRLKASSALLKEHHLELSVKNNIVKIVGNEYDKCKLINFLISNESNPLFLGLESCSDYFLDMDITLLKQIIIDAIFEYEYYVEDYYAENLYLNIIIVLSRIRRNFHMEQLDSFSPQESSAEFQIALKICQSYTQHYTAFPYQKNDVCYIAMLIAGHIKPQAKGEHSVSLSASINPEFRNIINDILVRTFNYYMLNIDYESFLSTFLLHVYALIKRARNQQYLQDITVEDLRMSCPFIYDVAVYLSKQLEQAFQIFIPDSEIGYIAIHIGFAIENATRESDTVKILLLCNDYHNTARQILEKLKEHYHDNIEIFYISSRYEHLKFQNTVDLIISSLPLEIIGKRIVKISPFYTSLDAFHVDEAIKQCQTEKESRKRHQLLLSCFHNKLFFIDDTIKTKEEAIRFLGNKIEEFGLSPSGFTASCLQREQSSSTCFFHLFAIPHALKMEAKKTMFSVLISPHGILWDKDSRIHLVFMITVNQNDRKEFRKIYTSIIQYLWDKEKAYSLAKVHNFTEFLDFFQ